MLVITYGITIGGLLLPIGSPPNLIGRGLIEDETGEPITFFEWFLVALPIVLVMFNYGFMLPVSTPPNAIVYSSG